MMGPSRPTAAPLAEGKRRRKRLRHGDDGPNHAPLIVDGVHNLRHAVTFCLGREVADDEGHADPASNTNESLRASSADTWVRRSDQSS